MSEPYDFLYPSDNVPLAREAYPSYAPILSFFVGKSFADVPFVTTDDWETATGRVFPPQHGDLRSEANRQRAQVPWAERTPTAFFRGKPTGAGVDAATNQRIRLATLSSAWATPASAAASSSAPSSRYGAGNPVDGVPFLDAGLSGWNARDQKMQNCPMTFIKHASLGIRKASFVPMYEQARFKYHIYVDGHCAAMRYASMMPLGAVILKVESTTKADSMWYFPLLKPFDFRAPAGGADPKGDHILVRPDCSDLAEVIEWCKRNDEACQRIAANSLALYERLVSKNGQMDYIQLVLHEIASRFTSSAAPFSGGEAGSTAAAPVVAASYEASANPGAPLLMPHMAASPFPGGDWFGASNLEYSDVPSHVDLPSHTLPDAMAKAAGCECPQCEMIRKNRVGAGETLPASKKPKVSGAGAPAGGSAAAPPKKLVVVTGSSMAAVAPTLTMNEKMKEALAKAAALAASKKR